MRGDSWNETEIKAVVRAYFRLLDAQLLGETPIKATIYRDLASRHKGRSAKAFEYKFQNISAILYEEKLPYADGLKPKGNYQLLLKLLVLNHLDRVERPAFTPKEILFRKLQMLWNRGYLPVIEKGTGRYGMALERHLGIPPNSSKEPDFIGIELKTHLRGKHQGLFAKSPSEFLDCDGKKQFIAKHGYRDRERRRTALNTAIDSNGDSLGFQLKATNTNIFVIRENRRVLRFDCDEIEEALLRKHAESVFIDVNTRKVPNKMTECRFGPLTYCKYPSMRKFLKLVSDGSVNVHFTLSLKQGKIGDHGFMWKILHDAIPALYLEAEKAGFDG